MGLDYLSLDRPAATLAGGEAQRIRLATQIGSGLVGVLYVLDEPSIGLHQRDNHRLIDTLIRLRELGNTLIVVEHDEDTIRTADWIVDIGPGAGEHGGEIVVAGTVEDLMAAERSVTGAYLSGRREIPLPRSRRPVVPGRELVVEGAREHNLAQRRRGLPARHVHRGHRGLGVGQVVAGQRHPLHGAGQPAQRGQDGARPAQAGARRRRAGQGRRRRPVGDRSDPAVKPGDVHGRVRPHAAAVRGDDRGQDPRLPAGPVLVQRQGRPLRGVRRRRHDQDRDELPPGRLRPVRGLRRRPVQPGDARGALQGQEHRRGPRHVDRGGERVLRRRPGDRPPPADAGRRRPRVRAAGPAGADPVRR